MKTDITAIDSISARLRQTEPTITDGDFTAAIMTQLPRSRDLPAWQKNLILLTATALGSAIVTWQVPLTAIPDLLNVAATDWLALLGTAVVLAYGAAGAAVWMARSR